MPRLRFGPHWLFLLCLLVKRSTSFNVDEQNAILVQQPQAQAQDGASSLFGYSLALNRTTLYVGAPGFRTSGGVFKCQLDGSRCTALAESGGPNRDFLGASMILSETSSTLYTCAPRANSDNYENLSVPTGLCYKYSNDHNDARSRLPQPSMDAFFNMTNPPRFSNTGWTFLTMMGHSVVTSYDDKLVIGAPMARATEFDWDDERNTGHFIQVDPFSGRLTIPSIDDVIWGQQKRLHSTQQEPHTYDLTGSAVVRGRFFYEGEDHYALGAPKANSLHGRVYLCPDCFRPRSPIRNRINQNIFFEKNSLELNGHQFGSRFGQTLCSVDLNGDDFDDLIVGAPLFASKNGLFDTGTVYVYKTNINGFATELDLVTSDLQRDISSGARFGASLANLGDLDGDGYQDFAVGAPFEGAGAVYIYRGSHSILFTDKPQKITPASLNRPLVRGFGASISGGGSGNGRTDVDENGRPDLAVGAITSGHAVVLRAREVVRINPRSLYITPVKAVDPKDNKFTIKIMALLKEEITEPLLVQVRFRSLDRRIQLSGEFRSSNGSEAALKPGSRFHTFDVLVQSRSGLNHFGVDDDGDGDQETAASMPRPIRFEVELLWKVNRPKNTCADIGCPMIDPWNRVQEELNFFVPLQSGCENNDACQCNLEVLSNTNEVADQRVVLGRDKSLTTTLEVKNGGSEPAYDATLKIRSKENLPFPRQLECENSTVDGSTDETQDMTFSMDCRFPSLNALKTRRQDLTFDLSDWLPTSPQAAGRSDYAAALDLTLESRCSRQTQSAAANLAFSTRVTFVYIAQIRLSLHETGQDRQLGYNRTRVAFLHGFRITNLGPSPTNDQTSYTLFVPQSDLVSVTGINQQNQCRMETSKRFNIAGSQQHTSKSGQSLIDCSSHDCLLYKCHVGPGLKPGQHILVLLDLSFDAELASEDQEQTNRYIVRTLLETGGQRDSSTPEQVIYTKELYSVEVARALAKNRMWPYIVGVIIGVLLLALLAVVLWKSNAFSKMRIFKNQLDDAQKDGPATGASPEGS